MFLRLLAVLPFESVLKELEMLFLLALDFGVFRQLALLLFDDLFNVVLVERRSAVFLQLRNLVIDFANRVDSLPVARGWVDG